MAVDNRHYVLEIEVGKIIKGRTWGRNVGDDSGEDGMLVNYEGEGGVDCLLEGGDRREGLEDVVTCYADVIVDI